MKRLFKWLGYTVGGFLALLLVAVGVIYVLGARVLGQNFADVPSHAIAASESPGAVAEGNRLAAIRGCIGCHGARLDGQMFANSLLLARLPSPNLSQLLPQYSDAELERAIRHGVRRNGGNLVAMPSSMFAPLSDADLSAIVAFLRSMPPVDHPLPSRRIGPIARFGLIIGKFHVEPAVIDHVAAHVATTPTRDRIAWGQYLARTSCTECHGLDLRGAPEEAPNLAVAAAYSDSAFRAFFETGKALGDRELPLMSEMVRERFRFFTDEEIGALHGYLKTLAVQ